MTEADVIEQLRNMTSRSGAPSRSNLLGIAIDEPTAGTFEVGFSVAEETLCISSPSGSDLAELLTSIDQALAPRWTWWDRETASYFVSLRVSIDRCWDVLTVHRLLHGGWRTSVGYAWAWLNQLPTDTLPQMGQLDLLSAPADEGDDPENPVRPDGHLRPEWLSGGWSLSPARVGEWAGLARRAAVLQRDLLTERPLRDRAQSTAHSESCAEMLCVEMERDGLPIDHPEAVRIISDSVGTRPNNPAEDDAIRATRDDAVVQHLEYGRDVNLRNPAEVKAMLLRINVDLPDTRAWRLEQIRDEHPLIEALLHWRKAERIATTYGYRWMDEHVLDGRLRGDWTASDGAAGRMTASAGLHNLPSEMRPAVAAKEGYCFIRADLGQIEPRVLAAVSGDAALIAATKDADLYQPIAKRLKVERDIAKVAVLGAMYGSTTGESAHALKGLQRSYQTAMRLLEDAAEAGARGDDVMTVGGRRIRMWTNANVVENPDDARRAAGSRGRFARNAIIQGAAAEFFKVWAILVRSRSRKLGASVVLCLHDELLVHAPADRAQEVAALVDDAVGQAAFHWSPSPDVRFVADTSIIQRWSEAKG